jgi:hypothetical protein
MDATPHRLGLDRDRVAAEILDGEAVILDLATGAYFSLDGAGALVWQWIEEGRSEPEMASLLAARFDVSPEQARSDLAALTTALLAEALVVREPPDDRAGAAERIASTGRHESEPTGAASVARRPYQRPELRKYTEMADMLALDPPLPGLKDIPWKNPSGE